MSVCDITVRSHDVAKDLGVLWDSQMTMISQIAKVYNTFILHLRNIMKLRTYLSTKPLKCIVELHWLIVVKRIQFKILLACYRCLNGSAPRYLTALLPPHPPNTSPHYLRSSRDLGMCSNLMFQNVFGVIVPYLWQHRNCGIICPTKSGPHFRLTFSNPY